MAAPVSINKRAAAMTTSYDKYLSSRTRNMGANAIREILKVVSQPGMVSLAGGIPAPESFPLELIEQITSEVFAKYGAAALQYDATEGFTPLREALVPYLQSKGVVAELDTVTVFSGSQNVLDAFGKIVISPGDAVVLEAPSYLGAISAFNPYEPTYISVATDEQGVIPEALADILESQTVKCIYLVPTFQNPTGRALPLERRKQIAELIQTHDVLLLEDDPYSALRYSGEPLPPIQQFAPEHVVYNSTFSKILSPGLRIGFCVAPKDLTRWLVIAKQAIDLHTQTLGQAIAAEYLSGGHLDAHLPHIIDLYRPRRDAMLAALDSYMPPGYEWEQPEGGMFLWMHAPEGVDTEALYWRCVEENVAFVPGKFFFTEPDTGTNTMRLNYTMVDETTIREAVRTLGGVATGMMERG
jgi:2-aminoadipate transaminase